VSTEDYPAKQTWQSAERAAAYRQARDPSRYKRSFREDAFIGEWLGDLGNGAVVCDVPCGAGRLVRLITERGYRYVGGDVSLAMIREAKREAGDQAAVLGFVNADVARLPLADNSVDCVILWRFLHHIPNQTTRRTILREAARVSRQKVLLSFYHSLSFTSVRRNFQRKVLGRKGYGEAITHWQLQRDAEACGLQVVEFKSFRKYVSINWFACLRKPR
jgi:ubiquinone/menaquinone biosynthesis C-methylase UbiE